MKRNERGGGSVSVGNYKGPWLQGRCVHPLYTPCALQTTISVLKNLRSSKTWGLWWKKSDCITLTLESQYFSIVNNFDPDALRPGSPIIIIDQRSDFIASLYCRQWVIRTYQDLPTKPSRQGQRVCSTKSTLPHWKEKKIFQLFLKHQSNPNQVAPRGFCFMKCWPLPRSFAMVRQRCPHHGAFGVSTGYSLSAHSASS